MSLWVCVCVCMDHLWKSNRVAIADVFAQQLATKMPEKTNGVTGLTARNSVHPLIFCQLLFFFLLFTSSVLPQESKIHLFQSNIFSAFSFGCVRVWAGKHWSAEEAQRVKGFFYGNGCTKSCWKWIDCWNLLWAWLTAGFQREQMLTEPLSQEDSSSEEINYFIIFFFFFKATT